jgi:ketosteroid isomerase-like protein
MSDTERRERDIRRLYDAFISGDFGAIEPDLHHEIEFINPDDAVETGTHVGRKAFVAILSRLHEHFDYDTVEINELVDRGDQTVAVVRFMAEGRGSGVPIDAEFAHLLGWEQDRLRKLEWFRARDDAVRALEG